MAARERDHTNNKDVPPFPAPRTPKKLTQMLENHRVQFEERDVIISKDFRQQLQERLPNSTVPQVFLNGQHLGDLTTIHFLNERGELLKLLAKVPVRREK